MAKDAIAATAEGTNEVRDGVIVLTKIHVRYVLRLSDLSAEASPAKVDRALNTHVAKCPSARSIKDSVEVTWDAKIDEA